MPVLVICNFHKDPIKTKQAIFAQDKIAYVVVVFFLTKGPVTPKSIV